MTPESYYGEALPRLQYMEHQLLEIVDSYPDQGEAILYCKSRIKSPESMMRKLASQGLPGDVSTALEKTHDAVGLRVVCSFVDDVYELGHWLAVRQEYDVIAAKDYIAYPKPNGYRSLHLIVGFATGQAQGLTAEIQLRTIAIDSWAALEHQLKYKRQVAHEKMIQDELKRCADEIASVDVSMQTLRDILKQEQQ